MKGINRYVSQTSYMLFFTLPMSIIGFVLTVTFTALGLALTPIGIGLPLLHAAIRAAHGMMRFDLGLQRELLAPAAVQGRPEPAELGSFRFRDMFTQARLYAPLLYWMMKLPLAVFQFASAVIFPLCGACMMISPAVYIILARYGIDLYHDDLVMNVLLTELTDYQRYWVVSGIGLVMVLIGLGVLNGLAKAAVRLLNGLGAAPSGQASGGTIRETAPIREAAPISETLMIREEPAADSSYPSLDSYLRGKEEAFSG
ncbi:sensor domain-containing protein [Gorillibacterium sp. sgz5001074]|uniref:sensor domain-containing protein n=1 Tax=Gorillibacterium sp. sgz5001074 TaxID=3446695 RepID=UPI003F6787FF